MKIHTALITIAFLLNTFGLSSQTIFDVTKYGAKNDGETIATSAINKAIEDCSANGGGKVYFPNGKYLSGTIFLKDNVELYLERGATILASTSHEDFPQIPICNFRSLKDHAGWFALVYAEGKRNIAINGFGVIDGQGEFQTPRENLLGKDRDGRPRNILFIGCDKVNIGNVSINNSGLWNQHYFNCSNVTINNIKVYNHSNRNNDGIDIDNCKRFILSNSIIDSSDDAICLKSTGDGICEDVIISNCIASSFCNPIKLGTESSGGYKNISISNCTIKPSINPKRPIGNTKDKGIVGISLEVVDGGILDGVTVNNIVMDGVCCPIYVRLGNRARKYIDDMPTPNIGSMQNISISNITAYNCGNFSSSITGIPNHNIMNIRLSNLLFHTNGNVEEEGYIHAIKDVDEAEDKYPQPTVWGNLPSSGLFLRHIDNIQIDGLSADCNTIEPRPLIIANDVTNLEIEKINVSPKFISRKNIINYK